jgi:phosphoglycerate dehydrogenase-like enzyme
VPAKDPVLNRIFSDIITYPNVISTPHIAGYTFEALYKMSRVLKEKLGAEVIL